MYNFGVPRCRQQLHFVAQFNDQSYLSDSHISSKSYIDHNIILI
jgi:hypothetical protein